MASHYKAVEHFRLLPESIQNRLIVYLVNTCNNDIHSNHKDTWKRYQANLKRCFGDELSLKIPNEQKEAI